MLHPGPNGSLYVTGRDAADVLLLKEKDGDNKFDDIITVVYDFKSVHGITSKDNYLYLCSNRELRRYPMNPDVIVGDPEYSLTTYRTEASIRTVRLRSVQMGCFTLL